MALTTEELVQAPHEHVVQFYGHDDELAEGVGRYLAEAVASGGVAIAIATAAHRRAFAHQLARRGIDVAAARSGGTLVLLDADEARVSVLIDGHAAPHRFNKLIGDLIREATADGRPVRAYGEIVALMWADGFVSAALELEGLWNGLAREADFSLYCAYPVDLMEGEDHVDALHLVCRQHSAIVGAPVAPPRLHDTSLERAGAFRWGGRGPAEARRFVTDSLTAWGRVDLVDDAAVIATELATKAVLHARSDFTVTISRRPDGTIRIAVGDASLLPPRPRRPAPLDGSGRGLRLIEAIAVVWGVDLLPDGKVVWAQLGRWPSGGRTRQALEERQQGGGVLHVGVVAQALQHHRVGHQRVEVLDR